MQAIEIKELTKYYGKARGIENVSLAVEQGDFYGFIGPNGAGKSTTIRTLLGLITATSGRAEIFGQEVSKHRTELLARIGYLPSETMFYAGKRVKDVLRFSADLRKRDCTAEAKRLCERLELDPSRKVDELSLGNRKKVGIVCALQDHLGLYLLDEPTSSLDPLMQKEFFSILKERQAEGATIFLSSHVLSEVQRYCRHAAVIREGKIVAEGTMEELIQARAKRVTIHLESKAQEEVTTNPSENCTAFRMISEKLNTLPGLRNLCLTEDGASFLYQGDIKQLLICLAELPVQDMSMTEPDLEEMFLHYYAEGEENV